MATGRKEDRSGGREAPRGSAGFRVGWRGVGGVSEGWVGPSWVVVARICKGARRAQCRACGNRQDLSAAGACRAAEQLDRHGVSLTSESSRQCDYTVWFVGTQAGTRESNCDFLFSFGGLRGRFLHACVSSGVKLLRWSTDRWGRGSSHRSCLLASLPGAGRARTVHGLTPLRPLDPLRGCPGGPTSALPPEQTRLREEQARRHGGKQAPPWQSLADPQFR
jgi:hypothetical protein